MLLPKIDLLEGATPEQLTTMCRLALAIAGTSPSLLPIEREGIVAYIASDHEVGFGVAQSLLNEQTPSLEVAVEAVKEAFPENVPLTLYTWVADFLESHSSGKGKTWQDVRHLRRREYSTVIDALKLLAPEHEHGPLQAYNDAVQNTWLNGPMSSAQTTLATIMSSWPDIGISGSAVRIIGGSKLSVETIYGNVDPDDTEARHFVGAGLVTAIFWAMITRFLNQAIDLRNKEAGGYEWGVFSSRYERLFWHLGTNSKFYNKKRNAAADALAQPYRAVRQRLNDVWFRTKPNAINWAAGGPTDRSFKPLWVNQTKKAIAAGTFTPKY